MGANNYVEFAMILFGDTVQARCVKFSAWKCILAKLGVAVEIISGTLGCVSVFDSLELCSVTRTRER